MHTNWTFNEIDQCAVQQLASLLPPKIFDVHAHIYRQADLGLAETGLRVSKLLWNEGPQEVSISVWEEHMSQLFPGRELKGGLFFPAPMRSADFRKENEFLAAELMQETHSRGLILVSPDDSLDTIADYLQLPQIVGFKPYHIYSDEKTDYAVDDPWIFSGTVLGSGERSKHGHHAAHCQGLGDRRSG